MHLSHYLLFFSYIYSLVLLVAPCNDSSLIWTIFEYYYSKKLNTISKQRRIKPKKEGDARNLNYPISLHLLSLHFSRYFGIGKQVGRAESIPLDSRFINRERENFRARVPKAQFRGTITIVIDATRQTRARKLPKYGWENVAGRKRKFVFPSNDSNLSWSPLPLPSLVPIEIAMFTAIFRLNRPQNSR